MLLLSCESHIIAAPDKRNLLPVIDICLSVAVHDIIIRIDDPELDGFRIDVASWG